MSALTDVFNAGFGKTATVMIGDPLGRYSKSADTALSSAAQWIGNKLASGLGYSVADQVSASAKAAAEKAKAGAIDTSKVVTVPGQAAPGITPIVLVGIVALLLWKFFR